MESHGEARPSRDELQARVDAVLGFLAGHLATQDLLDDEGVDRPLAQWIAFLIYEMGQAAHAALDATSDPDAARATTAWLACACADGMRMYAHGLYGHPRFRRTSLLHTLGEHLPMALLVQTRWSPALEVASVTRELGEVIAYAEHRLRRDPSEHPVEPRLPAELAALLPEEEPESPEPDYDADEAEDVGRDWLGDTARSLEIFILRAGGAAVLMHPGGPVGMPAGADQDDTP